MTDLPVETTAVLMQLSTHWVPTPLASSPHPPNPPAGAAEKSNPEAFIHFFVDHPAQLQSFLESVQHEAQCSQPRCTTRCWSSTSARGEEEEARHNGGASTPASADGTSHPYSAQIMNLLKSFHGKYDMDHALVLCKLYHFEKGQTQRRQSHPRRLHPRNLRLPPSLSSPHLCRPLCSLRQSVRSVTLNPLLLRWPLASARSVLRCSAAAERSVVASPASPVRVRVCRAFCTCTPSCRYFSEILQHHIEHRQHSRIIPVCVKYGATLPNLWVQALTHFAHQTDGNYEDEITQVLEHVERMNLLAPLMVLNILSGGAVDEGRARAARRGRQGGGKPISVVQEYVVKLLKDEQAVIVPDTAEIVRYQHETQAMKEEMTRLTTQPVTFQAGKCSACGQTLSLPAVHFLCAHSYHLRCCDGGREGWTRGMRARATSASAAPTSTARCGTSRRA